VFNNLIDQIKDTGFYVQLFFQGEPYINKDLPAMIRFAQSKNIYISISTNGHFVNEKNVDYVLDNAPDKLIFSVDGLDEESYQNYRVGGTFKQADEGLRALVNRKIERSLNKPFIELQFIVMKQNENQLENVKNYCSEIGVDKLVFKTMQISSYENAVKFLPTNKKYRRYVLENNSFRIKNEIKNHCFALWRTSVITWDGRVVPCCFDKDAQNEIGKINGRALSGVWHSPEYSEFRKRVMTNRKDVPMCTNCTEGLKVNVFEIEQ
jgi:radical SAM protein with 4Fe4S-binding SPASM domain